MLTIELINTGSELMQGWRLNTHAQWISLELGRCGYAIARQVAVDDTAQAIRQALAEALDRAELTITTGGLGPTSDDRTRDAAAELLGRPLREDADVVRHIAQYFAARQRPLPPSTRGQALVPEGALVLANRFGTAPGLAIDLEPAAAGGRHRLLVMLPGPPRELHPMFRDQVLPLIQERFPQPAEFASVLLKTIGLGESMVEERIGGPIRPHTKAGLELAFCARPGEVDIRLGMHGPGAAVRVGEAERLVRGLLGQAVFGTGNAELEEVLVRRLSERNQTLALAESCTGGLIAHRVTNVPGASAVLLAGLVTYSNAAKQQFLGVQPSTLATHGAVSEETAREMAEGVRERVGADYGLAVTGIAGPEGGSPDKPVGTVYIALATAGQTTVQRNLNPFDRQTFKFITAQQAMDRLRKALL